MPKSMTINVRLEQGGNVETFTVDDVPQNGTEADKIWGAKKTAHAINGTSFKVQAQGHYRGLRNREENPLTASRAAVEMKTYTPSEGGSRGMSKGEKVARALAAIPFVERVQVLVDLGLSKQDAEKAAKTE